ncbi:MAG TPA: hypothetical protein VK592_00675 [Candidatus Dormibacteraeota bacterium]|nr:hypothetical protein [Candidatus Dormibacteraeota bacterium]
MAEPLSSLIRPEPGPSLPSFARLAPPPPGNLVAAELEARSGPGDIVIDLHGRGGWVARAAIGRLRRVLDFESIALTRLQGEVVLRPPDLRHFDAALNALGTQPRGETGVRQGLNALFASHCPTCGRAVVVDEFIWDGESSVPFRKSYRCPTCRDQVGGGEQRAAPTDDEDAQAVAAVAALPEAVRAREYLRERFPVPPGAERLPDELLDLYTPRSLISLQGILERLDQDLRAAPIEAALRLALLHALLPASKLNSYPGRVSALRIANGHVRQPGERHWRERNPWLLFEDGARLVRGFIQRLEALPGGPLQARLGDDVVALADGSANVVLRRGSPALTGNVTVADRAAAGQARVRLVLSQPPLRWSTESLSAAYLTTAIVLGRDAAATLPLEPLVGSPPRSEWGWEAAALRRSLGAVAPLLSAESRAVLLLEPGGPEGLVAGVLGGVGAGYTLSAALLAEADEGYGGILEFLPPGVPPPGGPRTRANVALDAFGDDDAASGGFRIADVERAVSDVAVEVLQARGEPARFERLLGEVLVGLDRRGHLRRLVGTRTFGETEARSERVAEALGLFGEVPRPAEPPAAGAADPRHGPEAPDASEADAPEAADRPRASTGADAPATRGGAVSGPGDSPLAARGSDQVGLLLELIMGELRRPDHPRLIELEPGRWWLRDERDVAAAAVPLSDRVEWAVFSLLSTSGGISEAAFFDRIASMFRGHDTPDEALVRACLESYRSSGDGLRTADELQTRYREHAELLGLITEYGHRLGLRCWIGRPEQRHRYRGVTLGDLLSDAEQHAYLPLISRGDQEALEATDVIWYLRGKATFLFEVEWTAMLAEPLLRRGARIPTDEHVVRFLVIAPERTELVRYKLERSPLLRRTLEAGNWHIIKAHHLRAAMAREGADLDRLGPYLGLDPEIETEGEQLSLFQG